MTVALFCLFHIGYVVVPLYEELAFQISCPICISEVICTLPYYPDDRSAVTFCFIPNTGNLSTFIINNKGLLVLLIFPKNYILD